MLINGVKALLICSVFIGVFSMETDKAFSSEDLKKKFYSEAFDAWKALKVKCLTSKAEVHTALKENLDGENGAIITSKYDSDIIINGRPGLLKYHVKSKKVSFSESEFIAGYNSKYSYEIESQESGPRKLIYTGRGVESVINNLRMRRVLFAGMLLFHQDVSSVFGGKKFTALSFASTKINGHQCVEISFKSEDQHHKDYRITEGRVVFDTELLWSIIEYDIVLLFNDGATLLTCQNEYPEASSWISFPVRYTLKEHLEELPERPPVIDFVAEYRNIAIGDITETESTLEAFGLPKPGIAKSSSDSRWVLIIINLIIIGIIAALLIYKKTRASEPSMGEKPLES